MKTIIRSACGAVHEQTQTETGYRVGDTVDCRVCDDISDVDSPCSVVLSCWMPLTVLICDNCVVICELSIGFNGSWLLNCVTSSFRKRSWISLALVAVVIAVSLIPPAIAFFRRRGGRL